MKTTVEVRDERVEIEVYQHSKTVWIAAGPFHGAYIRVDGQTEEAAMKGWVERARHHIR